MRDTAGWNDFKATSCSVRSNAVGTLKEKKWSYPIEESGLYLYILCKTLFDYYLREQSIPEWQSVHTTNKISVKLSRKTNQVFLLARQWFVRFSNPLCSLSNWRKWNASEFQRGSQVMTVDRAHNNMAVERCQISLVQYVPINTVN